MNISHDKKRAVIQWILKNNTFYQREIIWLLQYIMKRDHILDNIRFVYEAHLCPRSIIISNIDSETRPFRFYKDHVVTTDVDKAFHDIRLNHNEILYMEFIFDGVRNSTIYASVLEEHPYLPDDFYLNNDDYIYLDKFIEHLSLEQEMKNINKKIDEALDQGNREEFFKWTNRLLQIKQNNK